MIVGVDLGTTNSAAAIWRDGAAVLVPNALGEALTPSAVSMGDDDHVLVGAAAMARRATHPDRTATSFKRLIGVGRTVRLGPKEFDAEQLSALVLAQLKADAEAFTGEAATHAVITVPAYFNDRQRKATRRAGELAGFKVSRLVNEPTAAALAFGLADKADREPFLVFDLGGGTFDVSIVEVFDGIVEVRASAGDNRLGGDDFNDAIVQFARPRLDRALLDRLPPDRADALLAAAAERTRRALSEKEEAAFEIVVDGERAHAQVTAAEFAAQAETLLARIREPVLRSLRDCGVRADSLSEIVLVGGATRMPIIRRAVTRMFGRFPNTGVHPDHAVALGAGVQAGLLARDAALDEVRLTDVCPFTLGVDHAEPDGRGGFRPGLFSPIIERNTPVPVSRVERYYTIADNQKQIVFGIYQGEAREVADNVPLGEITASVPRRPAGGAAVDCRFSYDSSGLLEVDATVVETGQTYNLVIADEEDRADPAAFEKRRKALAALKFHPREDAANLALMARGRRAWESFIGERRELVGQWLVQFEAVLERQEPRAIAEAREKLAEFLDALEQEHFL